MKTIFVLFLLIHCFQYQKLFSNQLIYHTKTFYCRLLFEVYPQKVKLHALQTSLSGNQTGLENLLDSFPGKPQVFYPLNFLKFYGKLRVIKYKFIVWYNWHKLTFLVNWYHSSRFELIKCSTCWKWTIKRISRWTR